MSSQYAGTESILQVPNTSLYLQGQDKGAGLLSVNESCVCWANDDRSHVITLEYPHISVHAISHDTSTFPHSCLYLLYSPHNDDDEEDDEDEVECESDPLEELIEMRFMPPSSDQCESIMNYDDLKESPAKIYSALCECQTLYPDPELSSDSQEEEEEEYEPYEEEEGEEVDGIFYTSAEGLQHLSAEGRVVLEHLEQVIQMPSSEEFEAMIHDGNGDGNAVNSGQFEDALDDNDGSL